MYFDTTVSFILACIAFVMAAIAFAGSRKSEGRLKKLEQQLEELRRGKDRPSSVPSDDVATDDVKPPSVDDAADQIEPQDAFKPIRAARSAEDEPEKHSEPVADPSAKPAKAPWAPPEKTQAAAPPAPPKGPTFIDKAVDNFAANWVIWLAALSLAFGGTFIVQYGIEQGYLGPVARVIAALVFGVLLIGAAEYLRHKDPDGSSAMLSVPVALATGGIASLFAGVIAAHVLYDLTNALVGFASMALVSWLAMDQFWR
jgi:uncharacterized membrane protein